MKRCTRCREEKPHDQFYRHRGTRDGLYPHCRSCHLGMTANWARLHPDKKRQYSRDSYWRKPEQKRAARRAYHSKNRGDANEKGKSAGRARWLKCINGLGGKCTCCGETRLTMLEIDHINGFGNAHRRKVGGSVGVHCEIIKRGFPREEFGVLCANCNQSKRRNGGTCEHKTEAQVDRFARFKARFDFAPIGVA